MYKIDSGVKSSNALIRTKSKVSVSSLALQKIENFQEEISLTHWNTELGGGGRISRALRIILRCLGLYFEGGKVVLTCQ